MRIALAWQQIVLQRQFAVRVALYMGNSQQNSQTICKYQGCFLQIIFKLVENVRYQKVSKTICAIIFCTINKR